MRFGKIAIVVILTLMFLIIPVHASPVSHDEATKLDPVIQSQLASATAISDSGQLLPFFVVLKREPDESTLYRLWSQAPMTGLFGTIISMRGTPDSIRAISKLDFVERIEGSKRTRITLDDSVPSIGAPRVWETLKDPYGNPVDGSGSIIGIVDTGIDYKHPDFWFSNGTTKVLWIWDQSSTGTPAPVFNYGNECNRQQIQQRTCTETDTNGHGTHVAGIAGSTGLAEGNKKGVAPGSLFIIVRAGRPEQACGEDSWFFRESDFVEGIGYILMRSKQLGKRPVVNLSLGGQSGPHDGTTATERALDFFVSQGAVIAVSAGNSGNSPIHATGNMTQGGEATLRWRLVGGETAMSIDVWYATSDKFAVSLLSPLLNTYTGPTSPNGLIAPEANVTILPDSGPNGNEWYVEINVPKGGTGDLPRPWNLIVKGVSVSGRGSWDAWIDGTCTDPEFVEGPGYVANTVMTIGTPGTARDVITAGAYITKTSWRGRDGQTYSYNLPGSGLAPFSSRGPTRDGRVKPDVIAPGVAIASARSSSRPSKPFDPDNMHFVLGGTSMSAPHVAGVAALMLQKEPTLSSARVKELMRATGRIDADAGIFDRFKGSNAWGAGKLDAYGATKQRLIVTVQVAGLPQTAMVPVSSGSTSMASVTILAGMSFEVDPFGLPIITVPLTLEGEAGTRFVIKDNSWVPKDSSTHEFSYKAQYLLTLKSEFGTPTGEGWYDTGSTVKFSVQEVVPANGFLGLIGVKYAFVEWTGPTTLSTHEASIKVDKPITLEAQWRADFRNLYVIIGMVIAALVAMALLVFRRRLQRLSKSSQTLPQ